MFGIHIPGLWYIWSDELRTAPGSCSKFELGVATIMHAFFFPYFWSSAG